MTDHDSSNKACPHNFPQPVDKPKAGVSPVCTCKPDTLDDIKEWRGKVKRNECTTTTAGVEAYDHVGTLISMVEEQVDELTGQDVDIKELQSQVKELREALLSVIAEETAEQFILTKGYKPKLEAACLLLEIATPYGGDRYHIETQALGDTND
jgi:hypothetical protein